jgi:DNA-binding NarL/FixJ family response regulator
LYFFYGLPIFEKYFCNLLIFKRLLWISFYKVLLVDDHQMILESLKLLFRRIPNVEIVDTISDSRQVLPWLKANKVDLFNMPYLSGVDLTLQIRQQHLAVKVILLTMVEDAVHIREAIKAGVHGYILKKSEREELERAIELIMQGKRYFSPAIIEELSASPDEDRNNAQPATIQNLTEREIEVLKLIAMEFSSPEIADKLFISLSTVETHRRNLFQKLNVKSAIGLTKYALKHGMVK